MFRTSVVQFQNLRYFYGDFGGILWVAYGPKYILHSSDTTMPTNGQYLTTISSCCDSELKLGNFKNSGGGVCFRITEGFMA